MTYWPVNSPEELQELKEFLKSCDLPYNDLKLDGNLFILYRNNLGGLVGSGGLEFHGDYCLLRSVAVAPEFRQLGHGETIAIDLITRARDQGVRGIYLLTETAEKFFSKLGFENLPRESAPKEITASSEFSSVCPVSALLMSISG